MGMNAKSGMAVYNAAAVQSQAFQRSMDNSTNDLSALLNSHAHQPSPRVSFMERLRRRVDEIEALKGEMPQDEHDRWLSEAKTYSGD